MDRLVLRLAHVALAGLLAACLWFALAGSAVAAEPAFGGIGLQVVPTIEGELVVLQVVDGTPADRVQLKPGDLIYQVDDFSLLGSDFGKVVAEHLWGPIGSNVTLYYRRPGVAGNRTVSLQRIPMTPHLTVSPTVNVQDEATVDQEK